MGQIRMTAEIRTDYDCETSGLPAERWAEAVFKIGDLLLNSLQLHCIAVVKKTFCFSNVFFYNHLYQPSVFQNLFLKRGAISPLFSADNLKNPVNLSGS